MGSASKGALSHRERQPAQEADALEPKRHRIRRRQPSTLTGVHCRRNPVESTALRMRTMETGNGVTPYVLSEQYGRPEQVPTVWHTGRDSSRSKGLGSCPGYADVRTVRCR